MMVNGVPGQQPDVVLVPIAREQDPAIVITFSVKTLAHARMTSLDLFACGPSVIRQVVAAVQVRRAIDHPAEIVFSCADPGA